MNLNFLFLIYYFFYRCNISITGSVIGHMCFSGLIYSHKFLVLLYPVVHLGILIMSQSSAQQMDVSKYTFRKPSGTFFLFCGVNLVFVHVTNFTSVANSGSGVVCSGREGWGLANPPGPMGFSSDVIPPSPSPDPEDEGRGEGVVGTASSFSHKI